MTSASEEQGIDTMTFTYGDHEAQQFDGWEATLHNHFNVCQKNPGHQTFIPLHDFQLSHLPEGYRDTDLFDLMRSLADLTVRVNVTATSPYRPRFWPDTRVCYPFNNSSKQCFARSGSGMVWRVTKYTADVSNEKKAANCKSCPCVKCQQSESPSQEWAEVVIFTATHVVYNDFEARNTTCRLFYDARDSPLVTLKSFAVHNVNAEADRSELKCVTCDAGLIGKLLLLRRTFDELWLKVYAKFRASRDEDRLTFIVSHPHGCHKQISIGQWVHRHQVGKDRSSSRFTYTTPTCPGSSGAPVYLPGYRSDSWMYDQHVHSGSITAGLNCSGAGYAYG
ncbi:hypothetical protein Btru_010904 [Bulinus truncatus]|nr:hypothetical protein Btru_010904 [Bulinus truncatus]